MIQKLQTVDKLKLNLVNPSLVKTNFFIKDCSLKFILKNCPHLEKVIESISYILDFKKTQYKYVTFDYQEIHAKSDNTKTCRNVDWHTDGENNEYLICVWGNKRTEFKGLPSLELESGTLYQYSSEDLHRGRLLDKGEKRVFLRVCFSNTVKPNNKYLYQN